MEYITHIDSSKYVMSLDNLDMGLLPTYTTRPNNSASLWTANLNINTKDYFEFQVRNKTEADLCDDDSTMDNESTNSMIESRSNLSTPKLTAKDDTTTICHICDIDLPAAYVTDHENSLKHKAYAKITDVVLSRSRKHILKKSNPCVQKNDFTYFCGPCASEVKLNNKVDHEKSKTHKKSVSLDRVLFELATLYTDHEHEELHASNMIDDEKFIKNDVNTEVDDNNVVISDIEARLEEFEMKTIGTYDKIVQEFDLGKQYTLSNVGNDFKISMVDGTEVIVSEDNFDGFIQIGGDHKFCLVCKTIVEDKFHKISDAHVKHVIKPFKDYNFIRNLDNSRSHCLICNKICNDNNFHIVNDKTHNDLLQRALVFNENKPKTIQNDPIIKANDKDTGTETGNIVHNGLDKGLDNSSRLLQSIMVTEPKPQQPQVITKPDSFTKIDSKTYLCNPCNIKLHVNNKESHSIGNKHALNSKSPVHYNMMLGIGCADLFCRVCNVYVADEVDEVKAHVGTNDHVQKYTNLLEKNHVYKKQGNFYCKPCDLVILNRNELLHIEKLTHEAKLDSFKKLSVTKVKNMTIEPQLNNTIKASNNEALPAVDNSSNKTNLASNVNTPTSNESKPTDMTAYFCDVCNVKVPNNPNNIRSHNDGTRHQKNLLKTVEEVTDSIEDSETLETHCHMEATEYEKSLMCKVCKVVVPNIEDNINEHVRGKKHDAAFKSIIDANYVESVDEKYVCKLCKVDIKTNNIFKHINQKKHLALLGNFVNLETDKAVAAEADELDAEDKEPDNISVDVNINSVDELYQKVKHYFKESDDNQWMKCRICSDVDIPNKPENVVKHSTCKQHKDRYKNLLHNNLVFKTEDRRYYCAVCECYIPLTGEVNHAKGIRHSENFTISTSKKTCSICDVDTTGIDMTEHIMSPDHVSNVLCNEPSLYHIVLCLCKYCKVLIRRDEKEEHLNSCHKFAVKDKLCFCTQCDPYLTNTSSD